MQRTPGLQPEKLSIFRKGKERVFRETNNTVYNTFLLLWKPIFQEFTHLDTHLDIFANTYKVNTFEETVNSKQKKQFDRGHAIKIRQCYDTSNS